MYDYIKGTLVELSPTKATLETQGVGYVLWIPLSCFGKLCSMQRKEVCLFTSFVVREDSHRLFGFADKLERDAFNTLSDVSGIGPKTALSIIGHLSLKELELAIHEQDAVTLCKVPGIGKKTAERLLLDLKDKLKHLHSSSAIDQAVSPEHAHLVQDALSALMNLGYNQAVARPAIKKTLEQSKKTLELSQLITLALKTIHAKE